MSSFTDFLKTACMPIFIMLAMAVAQPIEARGDTETRKCRAVHVCVHRLCIHGKRDGAGIGCIALHSRDKRRRPVCPGDGGMPGGKRQILPDRDTVLLRFTRVSVRL